MSDPVAAPAPLAEEDRLWTELHALVDSLPRDRVDEPGYFAEEVERTEIGIEREIQPAS